jgi:hypothetical protein
MTADGEYPARPMLMPVTVTLADPVALTFVRVIALTVASSNDIDSVMLPTRRPVVRDTVRDAYVPCPVRQLTLESDSHVLLSHALPDKAADGEYPARPMLTPDIVMLDDPVAREFVRRNTLIPTASAVNDWVTLPTWRPALRDTVRVA